MKEIKRDITTIPFGVIAHGVNCSGAMGSGVALSILKKYPIVKEKYHELVCGGNLGLIGSCQLVEIEAERLYVANCFTQKFYGRNGRFADPEAIRKSLSITYRYADFYTLPVYMPKIGCGLGGLDWEVEVEPIIQPLDNDFERVDTYICVL